MAKRHTVIDMQHHYIPADALRLVGKTDEHDYTFGLKRFAEAYEDISNLDMHLKWMDEAGVDMSILNIPAFIPNGYEFCRTLNMRYAEATQKYPDRFRGIIHIHPYEDQDKNRDEVNRGLDCGLRGIAMVTSYRNATIDAPLMDLIYEMAVMHGMPVFVHPTIRLKLWGGDRFDLDQTFSREYDIAKSFVEMVYGVLPRFPDLKIIYGHFGGGLPGLKGRLLSWQRPKNFLLPQEYRDLGLAVEHAKDLGLVDDFESRVKNIYFDSAGHGGWLPVIRAAFETLGADHLCFGTDYAFELRVARYVKKLIDDVNGLDVPDVDKEKFLSGNVKKLFQIA